MKSKCAAGHGWLQMGYIDIIATTPSSSDESQDTIQYVAKSKESNKLCLVKQITCKNIVIFAEKRDLIKKLSSNDSLNIFPYFDYYVDPESMTVVYSQLLSESIESEIKTPADPLTRLKKALVVLYDCVNGLLSAQKQSIVHLNIKPSNLCNLDGLYKLKEWNTIECFLQEREAVNHEHGAGFYQAPELFELKETYKVQQHCLKADIFSLGVVLLEYLGVPKNDLLGINRRSEKFHELALKALMESHFKTYYFDLIYDLCFQMLQKDPQRRISAQELKFSLEEFFQDSSFKAIPAKDRWMHVDLTKFQKTRNEEELEVETLQKLNQIKLHQQAERKEKQNKSKNPYFLHILIIMLLLLNTGLLCWFNLDIQKLNKFEHYISKTLQNFPSKETNQEKMLWFSYLSPSLIQPSSPDSSPLDEQKEKVIGSRPQDRTDSIENPDTLRSTKFAYSQYQDRKEVVGDSSANANIPGSIPTQNIQSVSHEHSVWLMLLNQFNNFIQQFDIITLGVFILSFLFSFHSLLPSSSSVDSAPLFRMTLSLMLMLNVGFCTKLRFPLVSYLDNLLLLIPLVFFIRNKVLKALVFFMYLGLLTVFACDIVPLMIWTIFIPVIIFMGLLMIAYGFFMQPCSLIPTWIGLSCLRLILNYRALENVNFILYQGLFGVVIPQGFVALINSETDSQISRIKRGRK